jgi:hypothetical protein
LACGLGRLDLCPRFVKSGFQTRNLGLRGGDAGAFALGFAFQRHQSTGRLIIGPARVGFLAAMGVPGRVGLLHGRQRGHMGKRQRGNLGFQRFGLRDETREAVAFSQFHRRCRWRVCLADKAIPTPNGPSLAHQHLASRQLPLTGGTVGVVDQANLRQSTGKDRRRRHVIGHRGDAVRKRRIIGLGIHMGPELRRRRIRGRFQRFAERSAQSRFESRRDLNTVHNGWIGVAGVVVALADQLFQCGNFGLQGCKVFLAIAQGRLGACHRSQGCRACRLACRNGLAGGIAGCSQRFDLCPHGVQRLPGRGFGLQFVECGLGPTVLRLQLRCLAPGRLQNAGLRLAFGPRPRQGIAGRAARRQCLGKRGLSGLRSGFNGGHLV